MQNETKQVVSVEKHIHVKPCAAETTNVSTGIHYQDQANQPLIKKESLLIVVHGQRPLLLFVVVNYLVDRVFRELSDSQIALPSLVDSVLQTPVSYKLTAAVTAAVDVTTAVVVVVVVVVVAVAVASSTC
eukprot:TRINITY_DN25701_c0_g1_i1.p1 TRINITY_DN25701_c0_g1~~TRINITY_DN25701_c0_g1_i1.p1  ORF type:complete len:130 (-),score=14.24 TRINITY_DN25701_c0_g1_i1:230-619(-)